MDEGDGEKMVMVEEILLWVVTCQHPWDRLTLRVHLSLQKFTLN